MGKVPYDVTKEMYQLKATFFYNKLKTNGYFELFMNMQKLASLEGATLNWVQRNAWSISDSAWKIVSNNGIDPMLVFVHPKILRLNPANLKYYRSVAMISQKALKALSGVSNIEKIEAGKVEGSALSSKTIQSLVSVINEMLSLILTFATDINHNEIQGMMFATAGTNIDGSWRNSIGAEGERVIRSIILKEVLERKEVSSIIDRQNKPISISDLDAAQILEGIDTIKTVNLINGYSLQFSSEPDISMYDAAGATVGVVEIKAGLDPAGALERLGAVLKSFENTLEEFPDAVTILVASCITDEVEARLGASMSVQLKYVTTDITSSEKNQRKFANRMRKILKLTK